MELPLDELEQRYDAQWLQEKVVSCIDLSFALSFPFFCNITHIVKHGCESEARLAHRTRRLPTLNLSFPAQTAFEGSGEPEKEDLCGV